jgi:hypothetical protein
MGLVGTPSEQQPGSGASGTHPAPALMTDGETGFMRQHGEPVNGMAAGDQSPVGDAVDQQAGDGLSDEARLALHGHSEPDPVHIERADIGTE